MAQYFEDWSGYSVGEDPTVDGPAGWSHQWDASLSAVVVSDAEGLAGKALQITKATQDRGLITLDAVDSDGGRATIKAAMLIRVPFLAGSANFGGIAARTTGGATTETGYVHVCYGSDSAPVNEENLVALKYDGGGGAFIANPWKAKGVTAGEEYWLYFAASGSDVTYSYAAKDTPETIIDTVTYSDSAIPGAGGVGIFGFTNGFTADVLAFGVGTNGDDAPTAAIGGGDVTPPVLSSPTGAETGTTTADGGVTTDEGNGTLYAVCTTSATQPSGPQIEAGQDHTGAAAPYDTSQAVSGTGVQSVSATGLTADTTYYWHFLHSDAADNDSNIVSSAAFTTDAVAPPEVKGVSITLYQSDGTTPQASVTGIFAAWWDTDDPSAAPTGVYTAQSTNASGVLTLDIDSETALAVAGTGTLLLYKHDSGTPENSLVYMGEETVVDIS